MKPHGETLPTFLRPYASHYGNRETSVRREAIEPHLKDGGIYRTRWWAELRLIVDQVLIDRDNNGSITLGIPTENFTSIEKEESPSPCPTIAPYPEGTPRRWC